MTNVVMIENLDMEKLRQATPEERKEIIQFEHRMTDRFEQEMDRLRRKTIPGSNEIYLIGISKKPWSSMRFIIGTEQDYNKIRDNKHFNDYMAGGRI